MSRHHLLAPENRRFTVMNVLLMPALMNMLIAFGLARLLFQSEQAVFLWGQQSLVIDLLISSFMACLITSLIGNYLTRLSLNQGSLRITRTDFVLMRQTHCLTHPVLGSLLLAIVALLLTILLLAIFVSVYDEDSISWHSFIWVKTSQAFLVSIYASLAATLLAISAYHRKHSTTQEPAR